MTLVATGRPPPWPIVRHGDRRAGPAGGRTDVPLGALVQDGAAR